MMSKLCTAVYCASSLWQGKAVKVERMDPNQDEASKILSLGSASEPSVEEKLDYVSDGTKSVAISTRFKVNDKVFGRIEYGEPNGGEIEVVATKKFEKDEPFGIVFKRYQIGTDYHHGLKLLSVENGSWADDNTSLKNYIGYILLKINGCRVTNQEDYTKARLAAVDLDSVVFTLQKYDFKEKTINGEIVQLDVSDHTKYEFQTRELKNDEYTEFENHLKQWQEKIQQHTFKYEFWKTAAVSGDLRVSAHQNLDDAGPLNEWLLLNENKFEEVQKSWKLKKVTVHESNGIIFEVLNSEEYGFVRAPKEWVQEENDYWKVDGQNNKFGISLHQTNLGGSLSNRSELGEFEGTFGTYVTKKRLGTGGQASVYEVYLTPYIEYIEDQADIEADEVVLMDSMAAVTEHIKGFEQRDRANRMAKDDRYALKFMNKMNSRQFELAKKEAGILSKLNHVNIIPHIESFTHDGSFCLVMAMASHGDLWDLIKKQEQHGSDWSKVFILDALEQIVSGLDCAHEARVIHRDLKPQNVLVHLGIGGAIQFLISDFGLATTMNPEDYAESFVGTRLYMAPEAHTKHYSFPADMWSVGCILYALCMLQNPFQQENFSNIFAGDIPEISKNSRSGEDWRPFRIMCIRMLNRDDPKARPTCKQLLDDWSNKSLSAIRNDRYKLDEDKRNAKEGEIQQLKQAVEDGDIIELNKLTDVAIDIQGIVMDQEKKNNPLHYAAERGNVAMTKALIKNFNVPLHSTDSSGENPLHKAAFSGKIRTVEALFEGLNDESPAPDVASQMFAKNKAGKTPEDVALDVTKVVPAQIQVPEILNSFNRDVISAADRNHAEVVSFLREKAAFPKTHTILNKQVLREQWEELKQIVKIDKERMDWTLNMPVIPKELDWTLNMPGIPKEVEACLGKPTTEDNVTELERKLKEAQQLKAITTKEALVEDWNGLLEYVREESQDEKLDAEFWMQNPMDYFRQHNYIADVVSIISKPTTFDNVKELQEKIESARNALEGINVFSQMPKPEYVFSLKAFILNTPFSCSTEGR